MGTELIAAISAGAAALLTALFIGIKDIIKAKKEKTGDRELEYGHTENLLTLMNGSVQELKEIKILVEERTKDLSENIDKVDKKLESFIGEQKEFNLAFLRHSILDVWATYREDREMPLDVYESTLNLYDKYKALGGNSYTDEVMEEMKEYKKY